MKRISFALLGVLLALSLFAASTFAQTAVTCDQDYTATTGDSLPKLASKFYGSASAYPAIVTQTNLKSETDVTYATIPQTQVSMARHSPEVRWKLCIPNADTAKALNGDNALPGLDKTSLRNATYSGGSGPVTLKDGVFSVGWPPTAPDSEIHETTSLTGQFAWGDLNGVPSAVVITYWSGGGTGIVYTVSLMQLQNGKPTEVASISTGDRSPVLAIAIQDNQVKVDKTTQGPDQPACCGTFRVVDTYKLNGHELTPMSEKELGDIASHSIWYGH
jgi:hypothetical protein